MSNKIRKMVEDRTAHPSLETARSLPEMASAGQSMQGYAAMNEAADDEISRLAYQYYLERQSSGSDGSADGDWFRAESEVRRRRS